MNLDRDDLIIKYIQNDLSIEEKMELFDLTLKDEDFRNKLKEELELAKKNKGVQPCPGPESKGQNLSGSPFKGG